MNPLFHDWAKLCHSRNQVASMTKSILYSENNKQPYFTFFGLKRDSLNVYFSLQILKPWFLQYLFIHVYVSVCNDGRHFFVNFEALGVSL